jgi:bifunctional non-homologous end joining protein LigD
VTVGTPGGRGGDHRHRVRRTGGATLYEQLSDRGRAEGGAMTTTVVPRKAHIPADQAEAMVRAGRRTVQLTNLTKLFWPALGLTKRDLLQYYADIAPTLVPYLRDRAMVMKRYPDGIRGKWFFMKRAPEPRPAWIETCQIMHKSRNLIAFPMVQDLPALLWLVNLGCIDLNPWYARCDDVNRPDHLHFDLDPGVRTGFERVLEAALLVRDALREQGMSPVVKTSGASGMHIYVPIVRGPVQKEVWRFAKALAQRLARAHPAVLTAEFRIADRPPGRVLVDYNQNAWGRTLASVYSPRPVEHAGVSTPVAWDEVEHGFDPAGFTMLNVPARLAALGDLWSPVRATRGRFPLQEIL